MTQPRDPVQYGLRFQILPDAHALRRAREVVTFCRRHRIPAVHLICNAEEWNRGHLTEPEIRQWLRLFRRLIPIFKKAGLSVNLNPWSTTLHCDRGRTLRAGQAFERMVSPSGEQAKAVASFACPKWRRYLVSFYGRMAALGFETLWLEDDFRYHNHGPLKDWGGDFSNAMLKRFAAKIGRRVTRQQVVAAVLKPGKPHPWRALWLDLWRECQEATARAIRDAVAAANPRAQLGLMSSNPDTHAAEGRRWEDLFGAMAINGRAAHRPNFASYSNDFQAAYSFNLLDIQKSLRPDWVEAYPEIENFPYSRFKKSDTVTFTQMALAKIMGSEGLLLNLQPMTGNGVFEERGIGEILDRSYPALAWLGRHFSRQMTSRGVGVPFRSQAAASRRLPPGQSYSHLVVDSTSPARLLAKLGIAYQTRESPAVNLLWGPMPWAYSTEELATFLSHGLWLDAEAAVIMVERGFARDLGISPGGWLDREESLYAMEQITTAETGVRRGFRASCNGFKRILKFTPAPKARVWTEVIDCLNRTVGPGLSVFRNPRGGTVAISAFPLFGEPERWNLNYQRQTLAQNLVRRLAGGAPPAMALEAPHVLAMDLSDGRLRRVVTINLWNDPAAATVTIPGARRIAAVTAIAPLSRPRPLRYRAVSCSQGVKVTPAAPAPQYGLMIVDVE